MARFAPMVLLFCTSAALAQPDGQADAVEDVENAKTPSSLVGLLPEGEEDWPSDFWLIASMSQAGGEGDTAYMGWSIRRAGMDIELGLKMGDSGFGVTTRMIYGPDGRVKAFHSSEVRGTDSTPTIVTGEVEGDEFVLTRVRQREGREPRRSTNRVPMTRFDEGYPLELLPLIVGYHARQGNLGYKIPLIIMDGIGADIELLASAEDVGTEQAEVGGRVQPVHVLVALLREDPGEEGDDVFKMSLRFTRRGGFVGMSMQADGMSITAERATHEEVVEAFGLDKRQDDDGGAGEAGEAGEKPE